MKIYNEFRRDLCNVLTAFVESYAGGDKIPNARIDDIDAMNHLISLGDRHKNAYLFTQEIKAYVDEMGSALY
ncbi:MAG: hypothetical protein KDH94_05790, partial [Coxiellaceae bacterium]|nr:hypothetical protein [Coxiellaceae bacterium]